MAERAPAGTWRELAQRALHRKLARVALVVLWLLGASAVYAPLIANDKPLYLRGSDHVAYASALDSLVTLTRELEAKLHVVDSERAAWSHRPLPPELARHAQQTLKVIRLRSSWISRQAPSGAEVGGLRTVEETLEKVVTTGENYDRVSAWVIAGVAAHEADRARDALRTAVGEHELRATTSYPALAELARVDFFCMALWPWLLVLAVVPRSKPRWGPGHLAIPAALFAWTAAALVPLVVPRDLRLSTLGFKPAIAGGELEVESALFAPIAFGFDETNSGEALRPPTWLAASEIDNEGRYLRGPRRRSADPVTGSLPPGNPVRVLPYEPERNSTWRHPLGTDALGRDLLTRLLWGARASLVIGLLSAAIVVALGVAMGALAGWFGRWVDACLSRTIEVFASFPAVFVIIVVAALIPARALDPVLAIPLVVGAIGWTSVARLMRGEVLRVKALDYVAAARVLGLSDARIVARHVLPNAIQPVIVAAAFLVGWGIFVEAGVSFLGFGVEAPRPSWGALLGGAHEPWWTQVFPGLAIAATVIACYSLGEALRDALDPRTLL